MFIVRSQRLIRHHFFFFYNLLVFKKIAPNYSHHGIMLCGLDKTKKKIEKFKFILDQIANVSHYQ